MTDKERRLGLENAKLAMKIHRQRLTIRMMKGPINTALHSSTITIFDTQREIAIIKDQNAKLITENRALRLLVLSHHG